MNPAVNDAYRKGVDRKIARKRHQVRRATLACLAVAGGALIAVVASGATLAAIDENGSGSEILKRVITACSVTAFLGMVGLHMLEDHQRTLDEWELALSVERLRTNVAVDFHPLAWAFKRLRLPNSAKIDDVRRAYRREMRGAHPDLHPTEAKRARDLTVAYNALKEYLT